jgi:hypothetical protein
MYSWPNVAQRTAAVYDTLAAAGAADAGGAAAAAGAAGRCSSSTAADTSTSTTSRASRIAAAQRQLLPRLRRYRGIGPWAGLVMCCIVLWLHWFWLLLEWTQPAEQVDVAPDWPALDGSGDAACEGQQQQQQQQQQQHRSSRRPPLHTHAQPERGADARAPSRYSLRSASTPTAAKRLN